MIASPWTRVTRGAIGAVVTVATLVAGGGCGTRVEREAASGVSQAASQESLPKVDGAGQELAPPTPPSSLPAPVAGQTGDVPTATGAGAVRPSAAPTGKAPMAGGTRGSAQPATAAGGRPSSGGAAAGGAKTAPQGPTPTAPVPAAPRGRLSPVVLASVGNYSGPVGVNAVPVVQGAQVWVSYVNQAGGLNGHPVELVIYDDAGDPARHRAQTQEAIERRGAIAFLAQVSPLTEKQSVEYVNSKRVPVIGSETGGQYFYESPMHFPQASTGQAMYEAVIRGVAGQTIPSNKKKLGLLTCAEADVCKDANKAWTTLGPTVGFDVVYKATSSIAQPDFTAECLNARSAGAEVILVGMDANSIRRIASACNRQSYRPVFATLAMIIQDNMTDDPNLDGMVAGSPAFPWFQTGTKATDEYRSALDKFGGKRITAGGGPPLGWVAGKLLEVAGKNMPEPPTSAAILQGLWSVKGDTLGNLTQPLTFVENRPAPQKACWFNIQIKNKAWISPDGYQLHCNG